MAFKRKKGAKKVPMLAITALIGGGLIYAFYRASQNANNNKGASNQRQQLELPKNDFVPGNEMEFSVNEAPKDFAANNNSAIDYSDPKYLTQQFTEPDKTEYNERGEVVPYDPDRPFRYDSAGNVKSRTAVSVGVRRGILRR
jgi:hypothetical protein